VSLFLTGQAAENANKVSCPRGHPYAGENLYVNPKGARECRACHRIRQAAYVARKSAAAESMCGAETGALTRADASAVNSAVGAAFDANHDRFDCEAS
jgi:hypothetical protein